MYPSISGPCGFYVLLHRAGRSENMFECLNYMVMRGAAGMLKELSELPKLGADF
jgi:hypothetical protein